MVAEPHSPVVVIRLLFPDEEYFALASTPGSTVAERQIAAVSRPKVNAFRSQNAEAILFRTA